MPLVLASLIFAVTLSLLPCVQDDPADQADPEAQHQLSSLSTHSSSTAIYRATPRPRYRERRSDSISSLSSEDSESSVSSVDSDESVALPCDPHKHTPTSGPKSSIAKGGVSPEMLTVHPLMSTVF